MDWNVMSKSEARAVTERWNQMTEDEFRQMQENWSEIIEAGINESYRELRKDILTAMDWVEKKTADDSFRKKREYYKDLFLAVRLYDILNCNGFSPRIASNDEVWIYLCVRVFPDIVQKRYSGATVKNWQSSGITKKINVNEDRFWKTPRRIYLKVIWWYLYLSLQFTPDGKPDYNKTTNILWDNTTDEIVQLVERSGTAGYRTDVYRYLMRYYHENRDRYDKNIFRKVMVLNTARTQVIEPDLMAGGVQQYVKELFEYFSKKSSGSH